MKILVVGSGGREHALALRLSQSRKVQVVYVAPGNAGTALEGGLENVPLGRASEMADFCVRNNVAFTVVGPEQPLAQGLVDFFQTRKLKIFGPTKAAAQLESSKDFAKAFMRRHGIPTADYATFTDADAAHAYIDKKGAPIVIKADGLAGGKGVVVAESVAQAHAAVDAMMREKSLGVAGNKLVIEEFLEGEEASFIVMSDGKHVLPLATSQDHKRLLDGDQGPNTGGMGAYSPAIVVTPQVHGRILREIIVPTIAGMASEGIPFTGFLYAGLMVDRAGNPRVIEYNVRLGDPETQSIVMRLKSDPIILIEHALNGTLDKVEAEWDRRTALTVVLAAPGYPDAPERGAAITGVAPHGNKNQYDTFVFHAGTSNSNGTLVSSGGRVLCVTALGDSVKMAQSAAYNAIKQIEFEGMQYRRDIGYRATRR